jgi:hypothetical protein
MGYRLQIIFIFSIIKASLVFTADSYKCDISRCSIANLDTNTCVWSHPLTNATDSSQVFDISLKCAVGTECAADYSDKNVTCSDVPARKHLVDGDVCANNTDCASNKCNNLKCEGLNETEVCTSNLGCKIGARCVFKEAVGNCRALAKTSEACGVIEDCENNLGCLLPNKVCMPLFSLTDGSTVQLGGDFLCASAKAYKGYCVSTVLNESSDECKIVNGTKQDTCKYNVTGLPNTTDPTMTSGCQCSKAYSDRNFCEYPTTNSNWKSLVSNLKSIANGDNLKKHTTRRFEWDFATRKQFLTIGTYPAYKDADECAINIDAGNAFIKTSLVLISAFVMILFA